MKILLLVDFTIYEKFKRIVNIKLGRRHGGEMVVLRSLRTGLQDLGHHVDYRPKGGVLYDLCHVISGSNSWNWAVTNREKFKFFIAGPNLITMPNEILKFHGLHLLDVYLQPSRWSRDLFLLNKAFENIRVAVWACGVDPNDWVKKKCKKKYYLIYIKNNLTIVPEIIQTMDKIGMKYKIINYGSYSKKEFKRLLDESMAMVYISESESQGIALLEAWSCNVPTYVYQATKSFGESEVLSSAAPYLDEKCGNFFLSIEELMGYLQNYMNTQAKKPREYVLQTFTDVICAKKYLEVVLNEK